MHNKITKTKLKLKTDYLKMKAIHITSQLTDMAYKSQETVDFMGHKNL